MKKVLVIGIGVGDPDQLTVQAVQALNRTDVFFVMDKGPAKTKLRALREEICDGTSRTGPIASPKRPARRATPRPPTIAPASTSSTRPSRPCSRTLIGRE